MLFQLSLLTSSSFASADSCWIRTSHIPSVKLATRLTKRSRSQRGLCREILRLEDDTPPKAYTAHGRDLKFGTRAHLVNQFWAIKGISVVCPKFQYGIIF